jgi:hypothetical protein
MVLAKGTKIGWALGPQAIVYLYMKEKCKEKNVNNINGTLLPW